MVILFIVLFLVLIIINIYFLIKAIKIKNNANWLMLFSLNIFSIVSGVFIIYYSLSNQYLGWNFLEYLLLGFVSLCIYIIILIISSIFKILESNKNKKQNIIKEKLHKGVIIKSITISLIFVLVLTTLVCGIDYSKYVLQKRGEINTYNNVKNNEISKMASFLNDKYNMNINESDLIYYREQDYTRHSDIFGNGSTYNIPYIAVFEVNNEKITVVDRKGFISDNKQLKDLNKLIVDYYQNKTGIKFDYIEFRKSYVGSWSGNDNIINIVLQTKFNKLINDKNIEEFINYILEEKDLSIKFYIEENDNNRDILIDSITKNLGYLKEYSNIKEIEVYGYNGDLNIKNKEISFPIEHKDYGNSSEDIDDSYKFGCYYVDPDFKSFTFSLIMDLDRGYDSMTGDLINGWRYILLDK